MKYDADEAERLRDRIFELEAASRFLVEETVRLVQQNRDLQSNLNRLSSDIAPASSRGSDEEDVYLASRLRRHFHRPTCEYAAYLTNSANLIEFGSHREAVDAGYRPCKTCRA